MQLKYNYYYHKSALSQELCQKIVNMGLSKIQEDRNNGVNTSAYTFGDRQKQAMGENALPQGEFSLQQLKNQGVDDPVYVRDSEVAWFNDEWLYDEITPYIHQANRHNGWNWDINYFESFQFTVYKPSGFYSWHKDGGSDHFAAYKRYIHGLNQTPMKDDGRTPEGYVSDNNMVGKVRKISMTINLNNPGEYDGGNLKFDFGQHSEGDRFYEVEEIRPQGSIIVFPSFLNHCVTPVTRGTRYSLVLWSLGEPWR